MTNPPLQNWLQQLMSSDPLRAKSLVTTVFGDAIAPHGGAVWLGSLIELLAPFGISDRLVRTSVFRLAEEDWLQASREGRRSSYTITAPALRRFERAFRRIYAPLHRSWDGNWTLAFAAGGNLNAAERGALRKELVWEGFCLIAPGVFGHPSGDPEALEDILQRLNVQGKLFVCSASELANVSARPLRELVEHGWELDGVVQGYQRFIAQFAPLRDLLDLLDAQQTAAASAQLEPALAFMLRTLLIHAFRRVQLHDPQLPLALLPAAWPGTSAYELCRDLYQRTHAAAEQYLVATLQREDQHAAEAAPFFYQRFGGLHRSADRSADRSSA
ncbi:phenylacetic acid degradation operon negative regulatory protein PaaX [Undibacterium arcticum]|uniref:Phenylacetic acid degradation operon negative regulatory protein PaaX n=1 Tax=Undibacterium arcticum TaxID=1762892 RepID=A0ABV7F075_9BURK